MRKTILTLLALCICIPAANAYNERGLKTYKKLCKECHGTPFRGAAMKTMSEWEEIFSTGDRTLIELHKESPKALENIETSHYKTRKKYLVDFLVHSAKDSGVVPGCDSNYCGK